ncbi:alanine--tRNA ligase [Desulfopila inferna]|uniref:alanine--tRNA ligase n=1 Tax=Desulfopila inferna TaxID=468528 RepID=UPI001965FBF6|nr:alanine--tRNA ligase [Desulfopila inferna]MBM9605112.1 alanine--tRNA ligase [Desulfopila inferna]
MTGNEIRSRFLEYFRKKGHTIVDSSSLVPADDPTLLFTNAGMVQFKTVFMGEEKRDYLRATTSQRCVRAGGKHNDLENVGYTARHHTFFEMLGNFSFGDYFKKEAIDFAWEFLTRELGLPPEKLWVSIFEDDDEAQQLWEKIEGLPAGRIVRMGEEDNFWAMGDTGPCGPCSEIHIDQGAEAGCGRPECQLGCDCDRFLELWNLVFMQFNRSPDGKMTPLPKPSIDTGMGLERVAAVLQNKLNNYDSDLFAPLMNALEKLSGRSYGENEETNVAMRVIADHARAATFLVADGVLPGNEGRGYVLRRIMRRAIRFGKNLGLKKPFMDEVTAVVSSSMEHAYPHLKDATELLKKVVRKEEERFLETLENGLVLLDEEVSRLQKSQEKVIPGDFIFKLYDTYGFPVDIVRDISLERGIGFDEPGFSAAMESQRAKSRAGRKGEGIRLRGAGVKQLLEEGRKARFLGYDQLSVNTVAQALLDESGSMIESISGNVAGQLFVPETPFYAESGGQTGDIGEVTWSGGSAKVLTTYSEGNLILHRIKVIKGELKAGQPVEMKVEIAGRKETAANHTATHLLQAALREILGDHVKQAGSLVGPQRLRFDFTHFSPLSAAEIESIEKAVNAKIRENIVVRTRLLSREDAIAEGATALFGEKYAEQVRVVNLKDFSKELCGGTHVSATGEIGVFKILAENGIASGVRRIEAITGRSAFDFLSVVYQRQEQIARLLGSRPEDLVERVGSLLEEHKKLEKKVTELSREIAGSDLDTLLDQAIEVEGIKVVAAEIVLDSPQTLREVGDKVRDRLDSGVAVLGGVIKGKVALLAIVTQDLTGKITAGELVNRTAKIVGGKGGGRPDMAQAGGNFTDKIGEAIRAVPQNVSDILKG